MAIPVPKARPSLAIENKYNPIPEKKPASAAVAGVMAAGLGMLGGPAGAALTAMTTIASMGYDVHKTNQESKNARILQRNYKDAEVARMTGELNSAALSNAAMGNVMPGPVQQKASGVARYAEYDYDYNDFKNYYDTTGSPGFMRKLLGKEKSHREWQQQNLKGIDNARQQYTPYPY